MIKYTTNPVTKNTTSRALETLSAGCNLQEKSVEYAQNAEYEVVPDSGYDGLSKVNVSVDVVVPTVQNTKTVEITSNGETTIKPDSDYDVLEEVKVNTNIPLQEKTVDVLLSDTSTEILPDTGYTGITKLTVNHSPVESNTEFTATKNGNYTINPSEGYDATTSVNLNVEIPVEATKSITITENGTTNIIPSDGYDSIEGVDVTVNVSGTESKPDITNPYVNFLNAPSLGSNPNDYSGFEKVTGWDKLTEAVQKFYNYGFSFYHTGFDPTTGKYYFKEVTQAFQMFCNVNMQNQYLYVGDLTSASKMFLNANGPLTFTLVNATTGANSFPHLVNMEQMFACEYPYYAGDLDLGIGSIDYPFAKPYYAQYAFRQSRIKKIYIDLSYLGPGVASNDYMFSACAELTDLYNVKIDGSGETSTLKCSLRLESSPLSQDSVNNIINSLVQVDGESLTLSATSFAYLTEDQLAEATAKGWTINQA